MMEGYIETKMMGELDVARIWFDVSSSRRKTCEDDPSWLYCATYSTLWHIVQATIRRKENDAAQSPKGFLLVNLQIQQLDKIRRLQPALCCAGDVQRQLKHATRPCLRKALVQWMVIQEPSSCSKHGYWGTMWPCKVCKPMLKPSPPWLLSLSLFRYFFFGIERRPGKQPGKQPTSTNIKQHQATSTNINQYQPTSSNIWKDSGSSVVSMLQLMLCALTLLYCWQTVSG